MIRVYFHIVLFVANGERPFDSSLDADIQQFIRAVLAYKGLSCVELCVMPDHIHLLVSTKPEHTVLKTIEILKYWIQDFVLRHSNQTSMKWSDRLWLVSKSPADLQSMRKYFRKQADYHLHADIEAEWNDLLDWEEIEEEAAPEYARIDRNRLETVFDSHAFAE